MGGWKWGAPPEEPTDPNHLAVAPLSSSVRAQPSRQADTFPPHHPGLVTGRTRGQVGPQGHLSRFPSPCFLHSAHFAEGLLKA